MHTWTKYSWHDRPICDHVLIPGADNHTIIFDTSSSLTVGGSSHVKLNCSVQRFCHRRISRCVQNFVHQGSAKGPPRGPFKCTGFWDIPSRISAAEKNMNRFSAVSLNGPYGDTHQTKRQRDVRMNTFTCAYTRQTYRAVTGYWNTFTWSWSGVQRHLPASNRKNNYSREKKYLTFTLACPVTCYILLSLSVICWRLFAFTDMSFSATRSICW